MKQYGVYCKVRMWLNKEAVSKIAVFLDVTPSKLADIFLRHFGVNLPKNTMPRPRKNNFHILCLEDKQNFNMTSTISIPTGWSDVAGNS